MSESTEAQPRVVFYHRHDCCLCDEALAEIEASRNRVRFALEVVDVDRAPELAEKYGDEVPVVEIDGRKAFKYRLTSDEFVRRIRRPWRPWKRLADALR